LHIPFPFQVTAVLAAGIRLAAISKAKGIHFWDLIDYRLAVKIH